jgi:hypothetical protein
MVGPNSSRNFYVPTKIQHLRFDGILNQISAGNKNVISNLTSSQTTDAFVHEHNEVNIKHVPQSHTHIQLFFDNAKNWKLLYPFLLSSPTFPLQLIRGIADSYEKSLMCINTAQKGNWCLYNITPNTMLISLETPYAHKLCISPTNYCLQLSRLTYSEECVSYLFNTLLTTPSTDFMYKPIEIYILAHLWKIRGPYASHTQMHLPKLSTFKGSSISPELCDQICEDYMDGLTYMFETMTSTDSNNLYEQYFSRAKHCVKQLINCPYDFIVQTMLECVPTWDNYSISIVYIILINIARNSHRCTSNILLNNLINVLLKNTSPSLSERTPINTTLEQFGECITQV